MENFRDHKINKSIRGGSVLRRKMEPYRTADGPWPEGLCGLLLSARALPTRGGE